MTFPSGTFFIGVVAATIVAMIIGWIWYTVFGNYWMGLVGKTREEMQGSPANYVITFIGAFTTALILGLIVNATGYANTAGGIVLGLLVGVGFVATTQATNYLFEGRSSRLYGLNLGFHLLNLVVMGGIVGTVH